MATKTYTVEISVHGVVSESLFENSLIEGLTNGDIHALSFLKYNIVNVKVRPFEEQPQEWEVLVQDHNLGITGVHGYRGTEAQALASARDTFGTSFTFTTRVKDGMNDANILHYYNRDQIMDCLAKQLAQDIQMEIDDHDVEPDITTEEWLDVNNIEMRLAQAVHENRNK